MWAQLPGRCALPATSPAVTPAAVGTWAPPAGPSSSLVPTPTPPAWPAAPSPAAAPGSCCSRSRSLHPSPAPSSPACHRRLMVAPTPPPRQSSAQPARVRHPEMERLPRDQESQEHTRTLTHRRTRTDYKHRAVSLARSRADVQAPGGNNREAGQEGRGVRRSQIWAWGVGERSGLKAKGLETWQGPREPEAAGAGPGGERRRPVVASPSCGPTRGAAVEGQERATGTKAWQGRDRSPTVPGFSLRVVQAILLPGRGRPGWPCHQECGHCRKRLMVFSGPELRDLILPYPCTHHHTLPSCYSRETYPPDMLRERVQARPGQPGPRTRPPPSSWLITLAWKNQDTQPWPLWSLLIQSLLSRATQHFPHHTVSGPCYAPGAAFS